MTGVKTCALPILSFFFFALLYYCTKSLTLELHRNLDPNVTRSGPWAIFATSTRPLTRRHMSSHPVGLETGPLLVPKGPETRLSRPGTLCMFYFIFIFILFTNYLLYGPTTTAKGSRDVFIASQALGMFYFIFIFILFTNYLL